LSNKIYARTDVSNFDIVKIGKKVPQIYKENLSNPQIIMNTESPEKKEEFAKKYNEYYN
jgi:hypothetical protein